MFDRLTLPPGARLRIEYDPAADLPVRIAVVTGDEPDITMALGAGGVPDVAALQQLINMLTADPGDPFDEASLRALIPDGMLDADGKVTPEFLAQSQHILRCVGGPHDGVIIGIKGMQRMWVGPGRILDAKGPDGGDVYVDPPEGGVYHVHPEGDRMEWVEDSGRRGVVLPFARPKPAP